MPDLHLPHHRRAAAPQQQDVDQRMLVHGVHPGVRDALEQEVALKGGPEALVHRLLPPRSGTALSLRLLGFPCAVLCSNQHSADWIPK